jgi:catechol 2,3-dioxygenase-like lactoylglutathione lyase family enzyme
MTAVPAHLSAISLFVEDLAAAKAFCQEAFGVPVVYEDASSVAVQFDTLIVNLLCVESAADIVAPAPVARADAGVRFQLSIWVEDVDAVCAALQQRGVSLLTGPSNRPWGMRTATFVDPAGHSWEVAQRIDP